MSDHDPAAAHPQTGSGAPRRGPFEPPVPAPLPDLPEAVSASEPPVIDHASEPEVRNPAAEHDAPPPAEPPVSEAEPVPEAVTPPPEPPPPPAPSPAPAPAPRNSGGTPFAVTLLLTAALGGGIYYVWSHPKPVAALPPASAFGLTPEEDKALDALRAQLAVLAGRVDSLEKRPAPAPTPAQTQADDTAGLTKQLSELSARVDDLGAKQAQLASRPGDGTAVADLSQLAPKAALDALDQRVARLEQTPAPAAAGAPAPARPAVDDRAALSALSDRLDKLEQANGQARTDTEAGRRAQDTDTSALAALDSRIAKLEAGAGAAQGAASGAARDATRAIRLQAAAAALAAGQPLGELADAPPALTRFAKLAPPTEAALRAAFPRVAEAALAAAKPDTENRSFLQRALARLQQSVVVREGDHVIVGNEAAGILSRAEEQVTQGDLPGAAATLAALKDGAASAVHDWVDQVHALLDARAALATLAAHG